MEDEPLAAAHLQAFVVAVQTASVHGAADALGLTASAVTKRIQALERRTGATLFERGRFGLRTTAAGRVLYPEAEAALAAVRHAEAALAEHTRQGVRPLRLAASHTIGEFLLPVWLGGFRAEHPDVRAQVDVVNSPGVLRAVRDGEADLGFVEGPDELDGLTAQVVHRDEVVAVFAAGHPWQRRRALRARDLRTEAYVTREEGSGTRAVAAAALQAAGIELVAALELSSTQAIKRALTAGGFSLLSRLAVATEVRAGTLHALAVKDLDLVRDLRAVRAARPPAEARRFWTWLAEHAA